MALNFPNAPANGDKYTDPATTVTYKYNLANDTWTGAIYGEIYIDPVPGDVTITPAASSGSGTESSPWILAPSTSTSVGGTVFSTNTITFSGFDQGNLVKFEDENATQNGTRFDQPIGMIAANGTYSTNLTYTDTPDSPIDGTVYTGELKVGSTTVYFQWAVTQIVTTPLVQSSATGISATSWNPGSTVTMTPGTATGGVAPINYTNQIQKSPNGVDSWVVVGNGTSYAIQNADVGSYLRGSTIATDSGSQQQTLTLNSASSPEIEPGLPIIDSLILSKTSPPDPPAVPDNWTIANASSDRKWVAIAYGAGRFVSTSMNGPIMNSTDGINWSEVNPNFSNNGYFGITYAAGKFVAVGGQNPWVINSVDGTTWSGQAFGIPTNPNYNWTAIAYGGGKFVAVGGNGTTGAMYSDDAVTWSQSGVVISPSGGDNNWRSVAYGNGRFVAVSSDGTNRVMYSTDGINWTSVSVATDSSWYSVTYGDGKFVAVAINGTNQVMYSADGISWTASGIINPGQQWKAITYGGGYFVATCSSGGQPLTMYSVDGINWTAADSATVCDWLAVAYGNDRFVSVSGSSAGVTLQQVMYTLMPPPEDRFTEESYTSTITMAENANSTKGLKAQMVGSLWQFGQTSQITNVFEGGWIDVSAPLTTCYASTYGDKFVAISQSSITPGAMYSADGISWTTTSIPYPDNTWDGLAYGNGMYVAVASSGGTNAGGQNTLAMSSPDGINWTAQVAATPYIWRDVAFGANRFVAVAQSGQNRVMYSDNGLSWSMADASISPYSPQDYGGWYGITYGQGAESDGEGRFVAVGTSGQAMYSFDGYSWRLSSQLSGQNVQWMDVAYGNNTYVAVANNMAMYSSDGDIWHASNLSTGNFQSITYGGGVFVAVSTNVGSTHTSMWSVDGINWNTVDDTLATWTMVTYGNGTFVATNGTATGPSVMYSYTGAGPLLTFQDNKDLNNGLFLPGDEVGTGISVIKTLPETNQMTLSSGSFSNGSVVTNQEARPISSLYESSAITDIGTTAQPALTCTNNTNIDKFDPFMNITQDSPLTPVTSAITNVVEGWNIGTVSQFTSMQLKGVAAGGGVFSSVGLTNKSYYSTDGISWTSATMPMNVQFDDIAYGDGKFVAVGYGTSGAKPIAYTTSTPLGSNWTNSGVNITSGSYHSVAYGAGKFVALGESTTTPIYSTTGSNWTAGYPQIASSFQSIVYGADKFVTVASSGSFKAAYSTDGVYWQTANLGSSTDQWYGVTYGAGVYVAVGQASSSKKPVAYSTNGTKWTTVMPAILNQQWMSVSYGDGKFVAVSAGGKAIHSYDGINWEVGPSYGVLPAMAGSSIAYGTNSSGTDMFVSVPGPGVTAYPVYSYTGGPPRLTFQDSTQLNNFQPGDVLTVTNPGARVFNIKLATNEMELTQSGPWTNGGVVTGPVLDGTGVVSSISGNTINLSSMPNRFAIGKDVVSGYSPDVDIESYAIFNASGSISDVTLTDPGYVVTTNQTDPTVTFPSVFPGGLTPDAELGAGTSIQTYVEAIGPGGSDDMASNILYPTSSTTFGSTATLEEKNQLLRLHWEQTKDRITSYGARRPKYQSNLLEYIRTSGRGIIGTYDNDAYLQPKGVYNATDGRIYFINLDQAPGTTVDVSIVTTLADIGVVTLSATGLDPTVSYQSFITTLVTELASNANIAYASTYNALTWAAVSATIQSVVVTIT